MFLCGCVGNPAPPWQVTSSSRAVDWASGKQVGETVIGNSAIFNTMGGFFVPMSNGDVLITGVYGPVRLKSPMTSEAD